MTVHKVSELDGALLDAAVAQAERRAYRLQRASDSGDEFVTMVEHYKADEPEVVWSPSRLWADGGPLIEREHIDIGAPEEWATDQRWYAGICRGRTAQEAHVEYEARGDTPLIAAMRAYVTSKLGEEVELP